MSAQNDLLELYQEWRAWTEAEGEAIRAAAWPQVAKCQGAKKDLQRRILTTTEQAQVEAQVSDGERRGIDPQVRRIVDELILLELRNSELVDEQRHRAEERLRDLDQRERNLRQLQRAYAPSRAGLWQSYC